MEQCEPATVVAEVTSVARSRPATFLAVAAGVGVLAGRSSRALTAGRSQDTRDWPASAPQPAAPRRLR